MISTSTGLAKTGKGGSPKAAKFTILCLDICSVAVGLAAEDPLRSWDAAVLPLLTTAAFPSDAAHQRDSLSHGHCRAMLGCFWGKGQRQMGCRTWGNLSGLVRTVFCSLGMHAASTCNIECLHRHFMHVSPVRKSL